MKNENIQSSAEVSTATHVIKSPLEWLLIHRVPWKLSHRLFKDIGEEPNNVAWRVHRQKLRYWGLFLFVWLSPLCFYVVWSRLVSGADVFGLTVFSFLGLFVTLALVYRFRMVNEERAYLFCNWLTKLADYIDTSPELIVRMPEDHLIAAIESSLYKMGGNVDRLKKACDHQGRRAARRELRRAFKFFAPTGLPRQRNWIAYTIPRW